MEGNSEVILNVWLASNRSYSDGGGIYCVNSNLEVHASPSFNIADGNGGGVYLDNSSFTCLGHDINDNHGVTGKGIYMVNSTALLQDFDFYDNIVGDAAGANGGGIYCESSELYADSVEFDHNGTSGSGGAVYAEASEVVFNRCIFRENYANLSGGGIYAHASDLEIVNCTFDEDSSASGGCLYAEDIQDLMVLNTAMFETEGNNVIYFDHCQNSSVTYCDFYNTMANFAGNYPAGIGVLTSTNFNGDSCDVYFNIFEEPEFTSWWYYPTPQSPFIDAGDPDSPPDPDGTIADIGAYCYSGVIINVPGDYPTIQAAIDAAFNHDTVLVDDGTYTGPGNKNLDFGGKSIVVKSDNTISTCIIDCQNEGRGCYFHSGENSHAILSGFTIVNGLAEDGGAIYCAGSSPVVRQCVIRDNQAQRGGGIFCGENSGISVENCTLTRNSASTGGSAVYFDSSDATVVNTIVVENGGIAAVEFYYSEAQITYSDFDDNPLGNFSGQIPPGLGNVSSVNANGDSCDIYCNIYLEPQFMDPVHNNFQLQESSPCVDAGNPDPQYNDPQDPENPGYAFPPARGTVVSDMGAFGGTVPGWVEVNPLSPQDIRPQKFILHPNYPNPFNPITIISFELKSPGYVELVIYNINGREVARLVDGTMSAGSYKITFDGSRLSSGIYFARLNAGGFEQIQKLLLIK
jgi:predicted outer membrane repeat protein